MLKSPGMYRSTMQRVRKRVGDTIPGSNDVMREKEKLVNLTIVETEDTED